MMQVHSTHVITRTGETLLPRFFDEMRRCVFNKVCGVYNWTGPHSVSGVRYRWMFPTGHMDEEWQRSRMPLQNMKPNK